MSLQLLHVKQFHSMAGKHPLNRDERKIREMLMIDRIKLILIYELKERYTIVIVTHNLQQAARVSDRTAFFWLGRLVEYGATPDMFTRPKDKLTEDYITGRFG